MRHGIIGCRTSSTYYYTTQNQMGALNEFHTEDGLLYNKPSAVQIQAGQSRPQLILDMMFLAQLSIFINHCYMLGRTKDLPLLMNNYGISQDEAWTLARNI